MVFLLVEGLGLASVLMAAEWSWRLLKVGVVWQFLKIRQQWSLPQWSPFPFMKDFSVAWVLFDSILPTLECISEKESSTQPLPWPCQLGLCNILNYFLSFQQSSQRLYQEPFRLKKPLFFFPSLIRRKSSFIFK